MNFKSLSKGFTPTPKMILAPVIFILRYGKDKINFVSESLSLSSVGRKKSRTSLVWGFTLIELLVVIAIIGILSGIVLTSLNSARDKATDTKVKAQLSSMRAQAEMYYDTNGNYTDVCTGAGGLSELRSATPGATCEDNADTWAATAPITGGNYCVDYTGSATTTGMTGGDSSGWKCGS